MKSDDCNHFLFWLLLCACVVEVFVFVLETYCTAFWFISVDVGMYRYIYKHP